MPVMVGRSASIFLTMNSRVSVRRIVVWTGASTLAKKPGG
jgi:hypothetical protein